MTGARGLPRGIRSGLALLFGASLVAGLVAHLQVAWQLGADYYDATDYLINARFLAGHGSWFEGVRPPLVSLVDLPFFLHGSTRAWRGPHVVATLVSYAALGGCAVLFARSLSPLRALGATLLFAGSRLFVHYAPFVMGDLVGTGCVVLAFALHLRGREHGSPWATVGFALATLAAVAARHPLAILGPFVVGFEIFESLRGRSLTSPLGRIRFWLAASLPIVLFVGGMVALFHWRLGWDIHRGLAALAEIVTSQAEKSGITSRAAESRLEYLDAIVAAFRWPLSLLVLAGTFLAVLRGRLDDRLHALWLVANLALFSLVISRRESRYLLPALPSAVVLAVRALTRFEAALTPRPLAGGWRPRGVAALTAGLWVGVAAPLVPGIVTEIDAFRDPVYRDPFALRIAERAGALTRSPGRLLVVGDKYAVHPQRYRFTEGDEYYYFHHIAPRWFHYWLGIDVVPLPEVAPPADRWLRFPRLLDWAAPGDVIVVLEPETYQTRFQPAVKRPLSIVRVWADRAERDSEGACDVYRSARAALTLCRGEAGLEARVEAALPVEVYVPDGSGFVSRGWLRPVPREASDATGIRARGAPFAGPIPAAVMLATYDAAISECPRVADVASVADLAARTWPGADVCPLLWRP